MIKSIITMILLLTTTLSAQDADNERAEQYRKASEYIKKNKKAVEFLFDITGHKNGTIAVADTVVFIDLAFFIDEVVWIKSGGDSTRYDSLKREEIKKESQRWREFVGFKSRELANLHQGESGELTMYFSPVDSDFLIGCLVPTFDVNGKVTPSSAYESIVYLFYFNHDNAMEVIAEKRLAQ